MCRITYKPLKANMPMYRGLMDISFEKASLNAKFSTGLDEYRKRK